MLLWNLGGTKASTWITMDQTLFWIDKKMDLVYGGCLCYCNKGKSGDKGSTVVALTNT